MSLAPDLAEDIAPPEEIVAAALNGDLVLFVGSGASLLMGLPHWRGLAGRALDDLRSAGYLNYSEVEQLRALDPKKQLSIARLISEETKHPLNFRTYLGSPDSGCDIYESLNAIGCSCVTTNYDELLAPRVAIPSGGTSTARSVRRVVQPDKLFAHVLNDQGTVVHLHGSISEPDFMVTTTKEYLAHYDHKNVKAFLEELFAKKVILFVGYGLEEAEVLEHILRRGVARTAKERRRFALQGFFGSQAPLYKNMHRYYEATFGVHLLGFLRDREDYLCQARILKSWLGGLDVRPPPLTAELEALDEVLGNG